MYAEVVLPEKKQYRYEIHMPTLRSVNVDVVHA